MNGRFLFRVKDRVNYSLKLLSPRYTIASGKTQGLHLEDVALIQLKLTAPPAEKGSRGDLTSRGDSAGF